MDKIIDSISEFTAETLDNLRRILFIDYNELSDDTLSCIKQFKIDIMSLLQKEDIELDCIKKLQLRWTCDAIERNSANNSN